MENLQKELNKDWFDMILTESLRQWNDFKEDRTECTIEDFVEFTKEIVKTYFTEEQYKRIILSVEWRI